MRAPVRRGNQLRIGVAIPIPEPYTSTLTRARSDAGDPLAHSVPPHITLLPPTVIEPEHLGEVVDHLTAVASAQAPFVIELDGTASFRPVSPVVFVAVAATGANACAVLQQKVNQGPLAQELRFPYHPHVTIAHDLADDHLDRAERLMAGFDAVFPVAHFSLYEFADDGVWRDVSTFVLSN
ncbi:MAG TPA: 2'-5' RNA ligase family protein [Beutenbergiaceae bacterium]|nr:2'-5' RNA ligase family protein [Beutenbergiaceae bacterium]